MQSGYPDTPVADSTPFDDAVRGFYADVAGEAKTYEAAVTNIDLADIYTPLLMQAEAPYSER